MLSVWVLALSLGRVASLRATSKAMATVMREERGRMEELRRKKEEEETESSPVEKMTWQELDSILGPAPESSNIGGWRQEQKREQEWEQKQEQKQEQEQEWGKEGEQCPTAVHNPWVRL